MQHGATVALLPVPLPRKRDDPTERTRYFDAVASGQPSGDINRWPGNRCATSGLGSSTGISQSTCHRRRDWRAIGLGSYDYLIYAVGSIAPEPDVPGAAEFALRIAEFDYAEQLRGRLADRPSSAPVCVVGGGLTGIETAAELAHVRSSVSLLCGGMLGPSLSPQGRGSVARQLRRLGVTVVEDAVVTEVRTNAVVSADGRQLPRAMTVWTTGFGVPQLAARSGLSTDTLGRLLTDETLTSVDNDRILAAGDAAAPSGQPLRMSCQAALPLGAQAANTVLSRIAGEDPAVVNQAFVGQCISVGRTGATFQIAHTDDTPRRLYIGGRRQAFTRRSVS